MTTIENPILTACLLQPCDLKEFLPLCSRYPINPTALLQPGQTDRQTYSTLGAKDTWSALALPPMALQQELSPPHPVLPLLVLSVLRQKWQ